MFTVVRFADEFTSQQIGKIIKRTVRKEERNEKH